MFESLTGIGEYGGTLYFGQLSFKIIFSVSFLLYLLFRLKKGMALNLKESVLVAFFIFYLLSVIRLVFFPIDVWPVAENRDIFAMVMFNRDYPWTLREIMSIDLIPFRTIYHTLPLTNDWIHWMFAIRGIVGNFILLFPLAIFIGLLKKDRMSYKKAFLLGAFSSFLIESGQLMINLLTQWPNRLVTIDDVLLNSLGFLLGYIVVDKYGEFFHHSIDKLLDWIRK